MKACNDSNIDNIYLRAYIIYDSNRHGFVQTAINSLGMAPHVPATSNLVALYKPTTCTALQQYRANFAVIAKIRIQSSDHFTKLK